MAEDRERLRREVEERRGYWHPFHEGLLALSPQYLSAYLAFQDAPARTGALEPKVREFCYIAADGAVSHLYGPGLARHIGLALDAGATPAEVMEVIELTLLTAQAPHDLALPILAEEMARRSIPLPQKTAEAEAAETRHRALTGRFPRGAAVALALAPDFAEALLAYEAIPYESGPLPRKTKEIVRIAVAASPTILDKETLREAIAGALDAGASPQEIAEAVQLSSAIAIHTATFAVPALIEAMAARGLPAEGSAAAD